MIQRYFTLIVLAAMILGVITGSWLHQSQPQTAWEGFADNFSLVTDIFLRLIKMIIAPLVLSTLVVGIAHMGGAGGLGRVGARTLGWFILASILSLCLGLALVHLLQPGVGLELPTPDGAASAVQPSALNLRLHHPSGAALDLRGDGQ